jgi:hypothetical protein
MICKELSTGHANRLQTRTLGIKARVALSYNL